MATTGEIFWKKKKKNHFQDFRIWMKDLRQNSVEADIAAWQYVNEIVRIFWSGVI